MSQKNRLFLVVDANVLGHTHHGPFDKNTYKAVEILVRILNVCHRIVLDIKENNEECILDEYERQAKSELAQWWLRSITLDESGKIAYRPKASVHFSILRDPDDKKYLQVAVNSPNRIIISEDSHFTEIATHDEITSKDIKIWGFDVALTNL